MLRQRLKDEVEMEQELVNSLQNMVVVVDETSENSSDDGKLLAAAVSSHCRDLIPSVTTDLRSAAGRKCISGTQ